MIICETEFQVPDPNDREIALTEVDYYAWIPPTPECPNHRLSLRFRFATGQYEVYRKYVTTRVAAIVGPQGDAVSLIQHKADGDEQVVFADADLGKAIDYAEGEVSKYHGYEKSKDLVCNHEGRGRAFGCKFRKGELTK